MPDIKVCVCGKRPISGSLSNQGKSDLLTVHCGYFQDVLDAVFLHLVT
jgi:hypothetical protein